MLKLYLPHVKTIPHIETIIYLMLKLYLMLKIYLTPNIKTKASYHKDVTKLASLFI